VEGSHGLQQGPGDLGDLPGWPEYDDYFGYALASGDLNGDGYADLAIGVPYEDLTGTLEGYVNVVYGSSNGLTVEGSHGLQQGPGDLGDLPGWPENVDYFGYALVILAPPRHTVYLPLVMRSFP
jgi:hypothetical protein